jgi:phospholipid/cholesterol/gamma-HCH transport system substrate-binding protein
MNEKRHAGRVGLFMLMGLVLIAVLMLSFSRGIGAFKPKYEVKMRTRSVSGLRASSAVFLAGVQVGNVRSIELDPAGKSVLVRLEILKQYPLPNDSRFVIEQIGVLGDQFVIIYPGTVGAPVLQAGAEVSGVAPFNLLEVARSTTDLLKRFDQLGASLEGVVDRINRQVLDPQTLSNLSLTVGNFEQVSARTLGFIDNTSAIVTNNAPALGLFLGNMVSFSRKLENLAMSLDETIVTNRSELSEAMRNLRDATASMKDMTAEIQSGKGLVGGLLKDEQLRFQFSLTFSNLAVLSSNLSHYGLLYKPKKPTAAETRNYPGKSANQ